MQQRQNDIIRKLSHEIGKAPGCLRGRLGLFFLGAMEKPDIEKVINLLRKLHEDLQGEFRLMEVEIDGATVEWKKTLDKTKK